MFITINMMENVKIVEERIWLEEDAQVKKNVLHPIPNFRLVL